MEEKVEPFTADEGEDTSLKRYPSWTSRTFSRMGQGSVRGSIFTLASTAMGAGFLAIPTCLKNAGLILGLILVLFSGLVMYLSHLAIARAALKYKSFHYSTITKEILGKTAGVVLELAIILNGIGVLIAYQIASKNYAVGTFLPDVLKSLNISFKYDRYILMTAIAVAIVIPLGLFRHLSVMRYKALFNVSCLTYILILVICQFPYYSSQHGFDDITYFKVDTTFFGAFALCLFAYLCQQNLTKIEGELVSKSLRRMNKVITRAVLIQGSLFTLLAVFGYLSFMNDTPDWIIMRHAAKGIHHDWMMVLARFMESFTLTFAMPLNISPTRASVEKLCFSFDGPSPLYM